MIFANTTISTFVIVCIVWFARKFINKHIDSRFDQRLENHKAENDKKINVSKVKFDSEFQMYKELSNACFNLVLEVGPMFPLFAKTPSDPEELKKYEKRIYSESHRAIIEFQNKLFSYAPFISEEIYKQLDNIRKLCQTNIRYYEDWKIHKLSPLDVKRYNECQDRYETIKETHSEFVASLRERLKALEVIK